MSEKKPDNSWPDDEGAATFSDLCDSVRDALEFAYDLKRKNAGKTIPWNGLPTMQEAGTDFLLDSENLRYSEEDQGRDALDVIIGIAVQLGIEQGRRISKERLRVVEVVDRLLRKTENT